MKGPELKELRKKLGLSIAKASRQVEVSSRTWARWESTHQIPDGVLKKFNDLNGVR